VGIVDAPSGEARAIVMHHPSEDPVRVLKSRFGREFQQIPPGTAEGNEVSSAIQFAAV
jgi:hypothetical protein